MPKATTKTKAQLLEENTMLRDKLKEVEAKIKKMVGEASSEVKLEDAHLALGLYKKDGDYMMVKIAYDPKTGATKLVHNEVASKVPAASHLAKMNLEEALLEDIFMKIDPLGN